MNKEETRQKRREGNKIAARKHRALKKDWVETLKNMALVADQDNSALRRTIVDLQREAIKLKLELLKHRECPVSQGQRLSSDDMEQMSREVLHAHVDDAILAETLSPTDP